MEVGGALSVASGQKRRQLLLLPSLPSKLKRIISGYLIEVDFLTSGFQVYIHPIHSILAKILVLLQLVGRVNGGKRE